MRDLFEQDPNRFENFSLHINDLLFDFSKNRITKETLNLLIDLANHTGLKDQIEAMITGMFLSKGASLKWLSISFAPRSN